MTIAERVAASNAARVRMLDKWERETCPDWQEFAETLFGELEESHEANRSLTERLDRERALRMAAERERDLARERAHANMPLCVCAKWGGCHVNAGMAVVHFFDLARMQEIGACSALCVVGNLFGDERPEHETCRKFFDACTVRATAIETQRRLHSRTQAAESRAIRAERQVATLTARLDGAIREMDAKRVEAWARIEHEHCGSVIDRVRRICATDYDAAYDLARDVLAALPDAPIPPVALEASDGGARALDLSEAGPKRCATCVVAAALGATRDGCPECRRTIDGPSMRIGETVTLRPGDTLVTGGVPVFSPTKMPDLCPTHRVYHLEGPCAAPGLGSCEACDGVGWDWLYTPEEGQTDTRSTCRECEGSGKQRVQPDDDDLARRRVTERAEEEPCDDAACVCRARRADGASLVVNAMTLASEAHHAPGDGPLHAEWRDKPHRVVYDLCATVRAQADAIAERDARIAELEEYVAIAKEGTIARAEAAESALREIWSMVDGGTWPMYGSVETKGVVEVVRDRLARGAR